MQALGGISGLAHALAPAALTALHVLLALGVTAHVLLHRRAAASSIGWIGLAWLAPLLGSLLYVLLGINRVRRRALRVRAQRPTGPWPAVGETRADHLAALELAGERITRRTSLAGNSLIILRNGDQAYPQMLAAIDAAQHSLALSSYIFRADRAGQPFINALERATRRGVQVCVLIDGVGGGYFRSAAFRQLHRAGIAVVRFMHSPLPWRMPFLNLRNHRKILVSDGRVAFTGGLNIGAENLTRQRPAKAVYDTHFLIQGPVVRQVLDVFAEDWQFATGQALAGYAWFPEMTPVGASVARVVTGGPDQDMEKLEFMILEAIACARQSIKVLTPYFLPDERVITALAMAALRGVDVDLIIPRHSNHPTLDRAARVQIGPMLEAGCRIWTQPPPFDHSKLMTVDGSWCLIGSANWDMRSLRLNFELDLEIYDAKVAQQVEALIIERQSERIRLADLAQRSLPALLRDGAAHLLLPYL